MSTFADELRTLNVKPEDKSEQAQLRNLLRSVCFSAIANGEKEAEIDITSDGFRDIHVYDFIDAVKSLGLKLSAKLGKGYWSVLWYD